MHDARRLVRAAIVGGCAAWLTATGLAAPAHASATGVAEAAAPVAGAAPKPEPPRGSPRPPTPRDPDLRPDAEPIRPH